MPSHGADQFEDNDPKEVKRKTTFFNCVLLAICLGGTISLTLIVYVEDHKGWDWRLGFSTLAIIFGMLLLIIGLPWCRINVVKRSSAVSQIIQVYIAAIYNRKLLLPEDFSELYEIYGDQEPAVEGDYLPHTDDYRFLVKAAIRPSTMEGENQSPWKLCTVTQVENVRIILRMIPLFGCAIIMALSVAQLRTFSIHQASTMDTTIGSFHIPPASIPIIPILYLIIALPTYDQLVVPILRRFTGHRTGITYLQRIGIGLVISILTMVVSALVEGKRKGVARKPNMLDVTPIVQPLPISVFWIAFQCIIFGIAEMFTFVVLLEFFYSHTPKSLKSLSSCFLWTAFALGYFVSSNCGKAC